jgi:exoribonuclease R
MLLANVLIAEFIKPFCGPKTLLRAHADMEEDKKMELREFFNKIDMQGKINLTNSTTLSKCMETLKYSKDPKD